MARPAACIMWGGVMVRARDESGAEASAGSRVSVQWVRRRVVCERELSTREAMQRARGRALSLTAGGRGASDEK